MIDAFVDLAAVLDTMGGVAQIIQSRVETQVPGEMKTEFMLIEWRDRTDGRAQPEVSSAPAPEHAPAPPPVPEDEPAGEPVQQDLSDEEAFLREAEANEDTSAIEAVPR